MKRKNNRTLAKKMARTTRLCIFLAITVFSAIISFMSVHLTKQNGSFFAGIFANIIADRMSSPEYMNSINIHDLSGIRPNSSEAAYLYLFMKQFEENYYTYYMVDAGNGLVVSVPAVRELNEFINQETLNKYVIRKIDDTSFGTIAHVRILVNGDEVYRSDYWNKLRWQKPSPRGSKDINFEDVTPAFKELFNFFMTEASYYIPDSDGNIAVEIQVRLSSMLNITFFITLIMGILSAALASFFASMLMTSFFTRTVAKPVVVLEKNLKYLAEGNYDELLNSHIHVRKPISEIQSVADSTNILLDKMHDFNKTISQQNELLEKQNNELEAQNEELTLSKRQIREAQTQLVQNQNMASVGQLTAAISHEINTPLGTINSNVQLQNMILDMLSSNPDISGDAELSKTIEDMRQSGMASSDSCSHVSMIIKSLKNFSRLDQADFQESDINESARSVVLLTRYLWRDRIQMHQEYGRLPYVKCYPGLLNQVFMNILVNGIRSIRDKGDITIRTWADDKMVYASIRDSGAGITRNKLASLFETDYTADASEKGLGMGLSICKSIIDKHQGFIEAKSDLGKGTEFIFGLPIR